MPHVRAGQNSACMPLCLWIQFRSTRLVQNMLTGGAESDQNRGSDLEQKMSEHNRSNHGSDLEQKMSHVRAGQNSACMPLCSEHPHGICTLVKHVLSASPADRKWSILGAVCYRSWMECAAVARTSQNGQFFIKSSILVLRSQHPHGICPPAEHVHSASRADWKWSILGAVYYRS